MSLQLEKGVERPGANSSDHCTTSKDVVQCTIADTQ